MIDTVALARALRDSVQNISLQLNGVESALLDTQAAIEKQARYSAAIREIEMAILELRLSMMQVQESLDVTSIGKLSSVLSILTICQAYCSRLVCSFPRG